MRWLGLIMLSVWMGAWPVAARADYLSDALGSIRKGDLKAAQINLRNAVRSDPQNAEAHYWLGRVVLELGDPVAAEREALAARQRGYDPRQAVPLLAQAMLTQNKFNELLDTLQPDGKDPVVDASILVARGYALVGLKRPEDAGHEFAEAERVAPNAVEPLLADARLAMGRADVETAQSKVDRALAAQPKSADALLFKARLLRIQNDLSGAQGILDSLIADQPTIMQARLDRASLELATGKADAAKADIGAVLKGTPGNVQAIYLSAVLEAQSKNFKTADADLERISAYLGRIQRAYYLQAVVKEQLGQIEQAELAARRYLGREPNDLSGYKVLARIQLTKHQPDQVIDTLSKVTGAGKADAETYDLLGRAYAAIGRAQDAVQSFQKAEALAPNDIGLQTRLASVRMGMGDADAAMGDLEHTLTLAPKLPAVGEALFFAALATGDTAKAADALARIKAAEGDNDIVGNLTGLYKLSQIDLNGARATFTDVVQRYPDFVPARINLARVLGMQGDQDQSNAMLLDILAKQPTEEPALSMLAAEYRRQGRTPDAVALLERAHAAAPSLVRVTVALGDLYLGTGNPQKAMDLANAVTGPAAGSTQILGLRASAYLALGQKKEALATDQDILKQDPNLVGVRRQLVALLIDAGDLESARNALAAGIAANPQNYQLYQDMILIDLKSTGIDAALATADRLQAENRDVPAIRALKGDTYLAANRLADAIAAYTDANNAAPSGQLVARIAAAMIRSGKTDDATKVLQVWLAAHPSDLAVAEQASEISIATGKLADARTTLEAMLKQRPHDAVVLNNLAWVYQQTGDGARAQSLARQAYVLSPGPQTADTLGWILTTSGNPGDGLPLLRQATSQSSVDPRILYHYAVALKDTGNRDEAKKNLQTVVASKGEFKEKTDAQKVLDDLAKGS